MVHTHTHSFLLSFNDLDTLIKKSIDDALSEADKAGIRGKDVTPFILAAVSKITSGKSLQTSTSSISILFYNFTFPLD